MATALHSGSDSARHADGEVGGTRRRGGAWRIAADRAGWRVFQSPACVGSVCEQGVAEHNTLLVERVGVYVWFIVVRVALVHQVILDHSSNPLSYRNSTTPQRLYTIPQNFYIHAFY